MCPLLKTVLLVKTVAGLPVKGRTQLDSDAAALSRDRGNTFEQSGPKAATAIALIDN